MEVVYSSYDLGELGDFIEDDESPLVETTKIDSYRIIVDGF